MCMFGSICLFYWNKVSTVRKGKIRGLNGCIFFYGVFNFHKRHALCEWFCFHVLIVIFFCSRSLDSNVRWSCGGREVLWVACCHDLWCLYPCFVGFLQIRAGCLWLQHGFHTRRGWVESWWFDSQHVGYLWLQYGSPHLQRLGGVMVVPRQHNSAVDQLQDPRENYDAIEVKQFVIWAIIVSVSDHDTNVDGVGRTIQKPPLLQK